MEQQAAHFEADLAVVTYGWNDHWLAWGAPDAEKEMKIDSGSGSRIASWLARRSRIFQAGRYLLRGMLGTEEPLEVTRVSPASYRENLLAMGDRLEAAGTQVVFLTPPTAHGRLPMPAFFVEKGFAATEASVLDLHREYNEIVRTVATERGWPLLDLERDLADLPSPERIFLEDGIHLRPTGLSLMAAKVADFLAEELDGTEEPVTDAPGR